MTTRVQFAGMQHARARSRAACHLTAELLALPGIDEPTLPKPDGTPNPGRWHVAASGICGRPRKAGREPQKRPDKPLTKVCGYNLQSGLCPHPQFSACCSRLFDDRIARITDTGPRTARLDHINRVTVIL